MSRNPPRQQFSSQTVSPVGTATDEDALEIGQLVAAIWRGKWRVMACTFLALAIGAVYVFVLARPTYRATAVVMLETQQERVVDLQSVVGGLTGDTAEVNSELEVLRSRGLMGRVVDRLNLTQDPEFNANLRPQGPLTGLLGLLRGGSPSAPDLTAKQQARRVRDDVITQVSEQVRVRNVPASLVFQVIAHSDEAVKAARIADTVVALYVQDQLDAKFDATERATAWLTGRVAELQSELEAADGKLADFSARTDLVSVDALRLQEMQLKDLRNRIRATAGRTEELGNRLAAMRAADTPKARARAAGDPRLDQLAEQPSDAAAFRTRYAEVEQRMRQDQARMARQLEALRQSERDMAGQIDRNNGELITVQQLTREAEAVRLLYEHFLARLKETAAQKGIQASDSRVLSQAVIPVYPATPRVELILAVSGVLGLILGAGLVVLREARRQGFRTARELEAHTGLPVLGQMPQVPARTRRRTLDYLTDNPTSAAAEAVRNLRTSVLLSNVDNPPRVIVSTSSVPGEGKTTIALALAQNLVGLGRNVLLIEGDIRRRTFGHYFDDLPAGGLVSVLGGERALAEAVHRVPSLGADVLVGDRSQANAADLFSSTRFRALIDEARGRYDTVIIDTPPVLVVPDARIVSQLADAVLLSVQWDHTSRQQLDEALRLFEMSGQAITGLVLGQINVRRMRQYGHGGRYGAYAGYGKGYYAG